MKATGLVLLAVALAGCSSEESPPDREVDVEIKRYDYTPGTAAALDVEEGDVVLLRLHGVDVTHGFSILEYGISVEVPPGETVEVRFVADKVGDFTIYCTVFCGTGHPQHKGTLHVA